MELEVCCGSLQSALNAVAGGATRIELCSALSLDGLTPSIGLLSELRSRFPFLCIHVLIRPREGHFVFSDSELSVMLRDIEQAASAGASAIVSGALTPDDTIDIEATRKLIAAAPQLPFTFHRAFDVVADQTEALNQLIDLGVARVLTSGAAPSAEAGIQQLARLVHLAANRIAILPGGGVNRTNARRIIDLTGAHEIHGSCAISDISGLRVTDANEVQAIIKSINSPTFHP